MEGDLEAVLVGADLGVVDLAEAVLVVVEEVLVDFLGVEALLVEGEQEEAGNQRILNETLSQTFNISENFTALILLFKKFILNV